MKIIYACFGGAHSSVTAAAIHLGELPAAGRPARESLLRLELFDRQEAHDMGFLRPVGKDDLENEVYVLARGALRAPFVNLLQAAAAAMGGEAVLAVDTVRGINWQMVLGGILSRRLGLIWPGRWIVTWGTWLAYPQLVKIVAEVREEVARQHAGAAAGSAAGVIFCCCQTGRHASRVLAHRLVGELAEAPCPEDLLALPDFGLPGTTPLLERVGETGDGKAVYAVGTGKPHQLAVRTLQQLAVVLGKAGQVVVLDASPANKRLALWSQWLARCGFTQAARGLAARCLALPICLGTPALMSGGRS